MLSRNYIKRIVTSYLKKLPVRVKFGVLFGSSVYGVRLRESDIDLIVVSDDFKNMPFEERMLILYKNWKHRTDLCAFGFTSEEYNQLKKKSIVVKEADRKGIKIWVEREYV